MIQKSLLFIASWFFVVTVSAQECQPEQLQWLARIHPNLSVSNSQGEALHLSEHFSSPQCKVWPAKPELLIMANAWQGEEHDGLRSGDLEVLLLDSKTGELKSRYYQENQLDSDAVYVSGLIIDTAPYRLEANNLGHWAFGVRVERSGSSRPNPFANTDLTLFVAQGARLRPVLKHYEVSVSGGEWDTRCDGVFNQVASTLHLLPTKHKGFFDIEVRSRQEVTRQTYDAKNDDCQSAQVLDKTFKNRLQFNGTEYTQTTRVEGVDYFKFIKN